MTKRVVLLSYAYRPSLGGIERVSELLYQGLTDSGWEVRVVTMTAGPAEANLIRRPTTRELFATLRWSDVVLESNVSLRLAWPTALRLIQRPRLTVLHAPVSANTGNQSRLVDKIKLLMLPRGSTFTVSEWLASRLPIPAKVMPNPFVPSQGIHDPASERQGVLFVGRITRAKGLDVLLDALSAMKTQPSLTVVGDGPERERLESRAAALGLRVNFCGALTSEQVTKAMATAKVLCIPSVSQPPEVFPLVALEGIANGCEIVATDCGGLPEAVGPHGIIVPELDAQRLAEALATALRQDRMTPDQISARAAYLERYQVDEVVATYEHHLLRILQWPAS